ncbi:MAG TPA: alpha/beta hydrolase [Acidimicrobiia bacterium]|nr:alpha/beta hydrolase [Acidimicrobiia bacterium]
MALIERFTTRSGVKIRYLDNAPEEPVGLPILFSPGVTDFADEYTALLEYFLPRRVVVVEVRGRGGSEAPPTGYAVADHVRDLDAVVAEESFERLHVMTFSRGTSWALDFALAEPARIATLSIGEYRAVEVGMPDTFAEHMFTTTFRGKPMSERVQRHVLEELARESRARDLWDRLPELGPLLVARGGDGGMVDDAAVAQYEAVRPDVEVVTIPDAAHDLFRPDRTAYPAAIADFIARRTPGL